MSSYNGDCCVKDVSPIWEAFSFLTSQIESVDNITRELEAMLQGVLIPEGPATGVCKEPAPIPISAPLVQDLRSRAEDLRLSLNRLQSIRSRLAL